MSINPLRAYESFFYFLLLLIVLVHFGKLSNNQFIYFHFTILGVMFDYFMQRLPNWMKQIAFGTILGIVLYSFKLFHPLAYGFSDASTEQNSTMNGLRWMESWEF
jgi:dolichyl-phosphate-mannose--protein O-mannosyl transferase